MFLEFLGVGDRFKGLNALLGCEPAAAVFAIGRVADELIGDAGRQGDDDAGLAEPADQQGNSTDSVAVAG